MSDMTDSASPTVAEALPLVKPCTKCGVEKLLVDFSLNKSGKFGRHSRCRACICVLQRRPEHRARQRARQQRAYRQRPEVRERKRAYTQRPGVKERLRAYKQSPGYKEWASAYMRAYKRDRLRTDPAFKLKHNLCRRLRLALQGLSKSARTLDLIGCDIDFLRRWLEAKFLPGMTWENYGEWHVDHIMPCASFDLSDPVQQRTCFRWTNLQPLWAVDNIRKSDNYAP